MQENQIFAEKVGNLVSERKLTGEWKLKTTGIKLISSIPGSPLEYKSIFRLRFVDEGFLNIHIKMVRAV